MSGFRMMIIAVSCLLPAIGEIGRLEEVDEEKIEVICQKEKVKEVISAIKAVHPYEEIPLEIYPLIGEEELS